MLHADMLAKARAAGLTKLVEYLANWSPEQIDRNDESESWCCGTAIVELKGGMLCGSYCQRDRGSDRSLFFYPADNSPCHIIGDFMSGWVHSADAIEFKTAEEVACILKRATEVQAEFWKMREEEKERLVKDALEAKWMKTNCPFGKQNCESCVEKNQGAPCV